MRIGRGGKRGKTAGRGTKGQKARAGHRIRPEIRDLIKKLPKRRGYGKNRARTVSDATVKPTAVNVSVLEKHFDAGAEVSPLLLASRGLVRTRGGKVMPVKILGGGTLSKPFTIVSCTVSASAQAAIEKAGGKIS